MSRRSLVAAALVAAAAAAPLAPPASAVCESVSTTRASAGYCDEYADNWLWCAGVGVTGVAGYGACQPDDRAGVWVGCWTFQGLRCN